MNNQTFIRERLLLESNKLYEAGFYFPTVLLISQGIESLGAFIDKKPIAAKAQSKKRFNSALLQLFPKKYHQLINKDWLYKQLRCNLSHMCSTGSFIVLHPKSDNQQEHLALINGKRIVHIDLLLRDFNHACNQVIQALDEGRVKQKAMALV